MGCIYKCPYISRAEVIRFTDRGGAVYEKKRDKNNSEVLVQTTASIELLQIEGVSGEEGAYAEGKMRSSVLDVVSRRRLYSSGDVH